MFNLINRNIVKLNKFLRFNSSNKRDNQIKKNRKKFIEETNLNNIKYYKNNKKWKKKEFKKMIYFYLMKLLTEKKNYQETIDLAVKLAGKYNKSVIFHCYWNGNLNEKHLYSIMSCYYFNVYNNKHKIILWLDNNKPNKFNNEIKKYADVKQFIIKKEINDIPFLKKYKYNFKSVEFYSDYIRNILLYNYSGIWFDLDCFFLRSFDPIFCNFEKELCLHRWQNDNYPGNGIYMCLKKKSDKIEKNMKFIIDRNLGWGFQQAKLTFDLPLDFFILPCSWFCPAWIKNPIFIMDSQFNNFFEKTDKKYNFDNFFKGSFCYHWHNRWKKKIEDKSIFIQLVKIIKDKIKK